MKTNISLVCLLLGEKKSESTRKNDEPVLKILLHKRKKTLLTKEVENDKELKYQVRDLLERHARPKDANYEQIYTFLNGNETNIVYLYVGNVEDVTILDNEYELFDFKVEMGHYLSIGDDIYPYITKEVKYEKGISYVHEFNNKDEDLNYQLLMILTAYKYIKYRLDITDIMYKFLPKKFALEDVRLLYEHISCTTVDKSNFRKKILPYCEPLNEIKNDKGYRPTRLYTYKALDDDIWL